MKLCLAVNKKLLEGDSVSSENDGPIGISVLWREWNFVASEVNYFTVAVFCPSRTAIPCSILCLN